MEAVKVETGFNEMKHKGIFEYDIKKIDSSKKLFSIKIQKKQINKIKNIKEILN